MEDGNAEGPLAPASITQIGDYNMRLLRNLCSWAMKNEQEYFDRCAIYGFSGTTRKLCE